jgi:hypothetical protein
VILRICDSQVTFYNTIKYAYILFVNNEGSVTKSYWFLIGFSLFILNFGLEIIMIDLLYQENKK